MNVRNLKKKTGSFLAPLGLNRRKMGERPTAFILRMPDRFINTKSPEFRHAAAEDICKAVRKYAEEKGR
jgi:hypothetical protein